MKSGIGFQRGIFALWIVVMLPLLIGLCVLMLEWTHLFSARQQQVSATDAASVAVAFQVVSGDSARNIGAAKAALALNGYASIPPGALSVEHPPLGGPFAGDPLAARVSLTLDPGRLLPAAFPGIAPTLTTHATARFRRQSCLLVLAPTGDDRLTIVANALIEAPACAMQVNSSGVAALRINNKVQLTAQDIRIVGGASISGSATVIPTPITGSPVVDDPMAAIAEPVAGACTFNNYVVIGTQNLSPGNYCGGLRLNANSRATLAPGNYLISGGLLELRNNAQITGDGVSIFLLDSARILANSSVIVRLTASQIGPYAGIVIFESRTAPLDVLVHNIPLASTGLLEGLVYLSRSRLNLDAYGLSPVNTAAKTLGIIARHLVISGRLRINSDSTYQPESGRGRVWIVE